MIVVVHRGLFEVNISALVRSPYLFRNRFIACARASQDKVANVWVLMDLVIKLRKIFSKQELLKIR